MNRNERIKLAQQTLQIIADGAYTAPSGQTVSIQAMLDACLERTVAIAPEEPIVCPVESSAGASAALSVVNETTLQGARRLVDKGGYQRVGVLNFASAKNPGGGFLGGSQAQEESLARSSALYASLQICEDYYTRHRAMKSCLYTDYMILSPQCPVFLDDDGALLEPPYCVDFITCPAPNAGAIQKNTPQDAPMIPDAFAQRIDKVLALAVREGMDALVLGAWGCGVFRNDARMVAELFASAIGVGGKYYGAFREVVFSVLDRTKTADVYNAFDDALKESIDA
ncbi:TIGR02452 family protein [Cerasicoccus maritimus]|uniref:TIGR02452 family protein n=1 Tax=Cerasicoccus maritimus TaxID=490089 RepID=UPI0028526D60|nr:TIGR02452 family protein [Cerasicoccus maritimus]